MKALVGVEVDDADDRVAPVGPGEEERDADRRTNAGGENGVLRGEARVLEDVGQQERLPLEDEPRDRSGDLPEGLTRSSLGGLQSERTRLPFDDEDRPA